MYYDRQEAGRKLAQALEDYREDHPVVLGLPRGGVPVAYEVALLIEAPLDVLVARKIGAPMQPELAIGAVAPGGVLFLDQQMIRYLSVEEEMLRRLILQKQREVKERSTLYRGSEALPEVQQRTVILVDDGIATGLTVMAAVRAIRNAQPERLVLAVPVSSIDAAERLSEEVDDFVCPTVTEDLMAVGAWYVHFEPVSDEEVTELLHKARTHLGTNP